MLPNTFILEYAMITAVLVNLTLLLLLGAFLGRISQTSALKYGLMTLVIGIGVVVLLYFTGF